MKPILLHSISCRCHLLRTTLLAMRLRGTLSLLLSSYAVARMAQGIAQSP